MGKKTLHAVRSCSFSPSGQVILSCGDDGNISSCSRSGVRTIACGSLKGLIISPDEKVVLTVGDGGVCWPRLWDLGTGKQLYVLSCNPKDIATENMRPFIRWAPRFAFSNDGRFVVGAICGHLKFGNEPYGSVFVWNLDNSSSPSTNSQSNSVPRILAKRLNASPVLAHRVGVAGVPVTYTTDGHFQGVNACAISPDDTMIVSASRDRTLILWGRHPAEPGLVSQWHFVRQLSKAHADWIMDCAFSPDTTSGLVITASCDETLKIWNVNSGQCEMTLWQHAATAGGSVYGCAWSPSGRYVLSASYDCSLKLWDAISGQCVVTLKGHFNGVTACAFSPNGTHVLSASRDGTLRLWELPTNVCLNSGCAPTAAGRLIVLWASFYHGGINVRPYALQRMLSFLRPFSLVKRAPSLLL